MERVARSGHHTWDSHDSHALLDSLRLGGSERGRGRGRGRGTQHRAWVKLRSRVKYDETCSMLSEERRQR
eukprot:15432382-Alexandrium_andersonii.AAC.1